jgi:hypothetical protein
MRDVPTVDIGATGALDSRCSADGTSATDGAEGARARVGLQTDG